MLEKVGKDLMQKAVAKDTGILAYWYKGDKDEALYPQGCEHFSVGCLHCDVWAMETTTPAAKTSRDTIERRTLDVLKVSCDAHNCTHLADFQNVIRLGPTQKQRLLATQL
jgi:hypothetical protein